MSTMPQPTPTAETQVARPLPVLVPLIQDDLKQGREAAERASLPYYRAAGEKLIEAKGQIAHGEFTAWVKRHFQVSPRMARQYMHLAEQTAGQNGSALPFSSLRDVTRQTSKPTYNRATAEAERRAAERRAEAAAAAAARRVAEIYETTRHTQAFNDHMAQIARLQRDAQMRAEDREAERLLALHVIELGYKAAARELHPDKGGSAVAMTRLNAVRARLKQCVS